MPPDAIFNGTAARQAFLKWAVATNISTLFAQDFVGAAPNAGPEPNTTAAFCSFAQDAHTAGIDLHLYGALSLLPRDLAFIRACPMGGATGTQRRVLSKSDDLRCSGASLLFNVSAAAGSPLGTAAARLQTALQALHGTVERSDLATMREETPEAGPCLEVVLTSSPQELAAVGQQSDGFDTPEEFRVEAPRSGGRRVLVLAADKRGAMYGAQELTEQLARSGGQPEVLTSAAVEPHFPVRGLKFDLPWSPYRNGTIMTQHEAVRS